MTETIEIGQLLRLTATFDDGADTPTLLDPTAVTFRMDDGNGVVTAYVYGTDAQLVRDSTGVYYVDWPIAVPGIHRYRFESTGTGKGAQEEKFTVDSWINPTEPLSLDEAMEHLRVDIDDPFIGYLADYITAARQAAEEFLAVSLVTRSRTLTLDCFPGDGQIKLPNGPVKSVTSIAYVDSDGTAQTVTGSPTHILRNYTYYDVITPAYGAAWPSTRSQLGAVTITYRAGLMTDDSPPRLREKTIVSAIKLLLGDLWENREGQFVGVIAQENPAVYNLLQPYRRDMGM